MRGTNHLYMSMVIALPTYLFLFKLITSVAIRNSITLVMVGIIIGSLIPDLDTRGKSKIMRGNWRIVGYPLKYVVYEPLRRLLPKKTGHRQIFHSLRGCFYTTVVFSIITLPLILLGFFFMWYIWIGIPIGFLLHLAEDSFTYTGVKWFYPRNYTLRNVTPTNSAGEIYLVGISFIVFGSLTSIAYFLFPASEVMLLLTIGLTILLLVILHRVNPSINERAIERYTLEELVTSYIEDVGGKRIKKSEPVPVLQIENHGEYIVPILRLSTKWGLARDWNNKYTQVEASDLDEGVVLELRTYEGEKEKRTYTYYKVTNGTFYAFLQRYKKQEG